MRIEGSVKLTSGIRLDRGTFFLSGTGGSVASISDGTYTYNAHVFLGSSTLNVISRPMVEDSRVYFLVVGGGGSGGSLTVDPASPYGKAGGGGAGGFIDARHYVDNVYSYTVVVGGGAGRNGPPTSPGNNGGESYVDCPADTLFTQLRAYGGGAGGGTGNGGNGGSGGGGGSGSTAFAGGGTGVQTSYDSTYGPESAPTFPSGYGQPGGPWNPAVPRANPTGTSGSGGGGASQAGGSGPNTAGGDGKSYRIGPPAATPHPYSATYAGGGGGAPGGSGGAGGGAPGRNSPNPAPTNGDGGINTGGGGGGGPAQGPQGPWGSSGGSGIVIAWYKSGYA